MTTGQLGGLFGRLFESHYSAIEPPLIESLQEMRARGETPVVFDALAAAIAERFTGDPGLLSGWTTIPETDADRHDFAKGDVGLVLHFAWLGAEGFRPQAWRGVASPSAAFLVIGLGSGGSGFRGVFRRAGDLKGIYSITTSTGPSANRPRPSTSTSKKLPIKAASRPLSVVVSDLDSARRPVAGTVEGWLDGGPEGSGRVCVMCGRSEGSHQGDDGYDCILLSSRWLIDKGIVVPASAISRTLARCWPSQFKERLVTGVQIRSSRYGKYSKQYQVVYRSFVRDVSARVLTERLAVASHGLDRVGVSALVDSCYQAVGGPGGGGWEALDALLAVTEP